jgi:hypothetical protein
MELAGGDRNAEDKMQRRESGRDCGQNDRRAHRAERAGAAARGEFADAKIEQFERFDRRFAQQHRKTGGEAERFRALPAEERRGVEFVNVVNRRGQRLAKLLANRGRGGGRAGQYDIRRIRFGTVRKQGLAHRADDRGGCGRRQRGAVRRGDSLADGADCARRALRIDQHHRGACVIDIDHQMRAARAVAGAREEARERQRAERDALRFEPGAGHHIQMDTHVRFACEGGDYQRLAVFRADSGESDGGVVNRERQMLLKGERHDLAQLATIIEREGQKPLGDEFGRQGGDHDIGGAGLGQNSSDRGGEIGFALDARLFPRADKIERFP